MDCSGTFTGSCDPGYQLVTQVVTIPYNGAVAVTADIDIPAGASVVGAGGSITDLWQQNPTEQWVSLSTSSAPYQMVASGPHPTDSTKWHFQINAATSGYNGAKFLIWIAVIVP